jgi:hypothetical protein
MTQQIDERHEGWSARVKHLYVPGGCTDHFSVEQDRIPEGSQLHASLYAPYRAAM